MPLGSWRPTQLELPLPRLTALALDSLVTSQQGCFLALSRLPQIRSSSENGVRVPVCMCVSPPDRLLLARRRGTHPSESGLRAPWLVTGSAQTIRRPASFCPGIASMDPFFTPKRIPGQEVPLKSLSPLATPASCKRLPWRREEDRSKKSRGWSPSGFPGGLKQDGSGTRAFPGHSARLGEGGAPLQAGGGGQGWAGGRLSVDLFPS